MENGKLRPFALANVLRLLFVALLVQGCQLQNPRSRRKISGIAGLGDSGGSTDVNTKPTVSERVRIVAALGTTSSFNLTGVDAEGDALSFSISPSDQLVVSGQHTITFNEANGAMSATFHAAPTPVADKVFTYRACDAYDCSDPAILRFQFNLAGTSGPSNQAPTVGPMGPQTMTASMPTLPIFLVANDANQSSDSLQYVLDPLDVVDNAPDAVLSGFSEVDTNKEVMITRTGPRGGTISFKYKVIDAANAESAKLTVNVTIEEDLPDNDPPTVGPVGVNNVITLPSTAEGFILSLTADDDQTAPNNLSFETEILSGAPRLNTQFGADKIAYTRATGVNTGENVSFRYRVSDEQGLFSDWLTVQVVVQAFTPNVTPTITTPAASNIDYTSDADSITITFAATDDRPVEELVFQLSVPANNANGTWTLPSGHRSLTYNRLQHPTTQQVLNFSLTVRDAANASATRNFTLTIPARVAPLHTTVCNQNENSCEATDGLDREQGFDRNHDFMARSISSDGTKIVLEAYGGGISKTTTDRSVPPVDGNNVFDIFMMDLNTGIVSLISSSHASRTGSNSTPLQTGNNWSRYASISPNGRYVVFASLAKNLTATTLGDSVRAQIYLWDRDAPTTLTRMSDTAYESEYPKVADDGVVVYHTKFSDTTTAKRVMAAQIVSGSVVRKEIVTTHSYSSGAHNHAWSNAFPEISGDGSTIAFVESYVDGPTTNNRDKTQVIRLPLRGSTVSPLTSTRLSSTDTQNITNFSGARANQNCDFPTLSHNGNRVVYTSYATNIPGATENFKSVVVYDAAQSQHFVVLKSRNADAVARLSPDGLFLAHVYVNPLSNIWTLGLCTLTQPVSTTCDNPYTIYTRTSEFMNDVSAMAVSNITRPNSGTAYSGRILIGSDRDLTPVDAQDASALDAFVFTPQTPSGVLPPR